MNTKNILMALIALIIITASAQAQNRAQAAGTLFGGIVGGITAHNSGHSSHHKTKDGIRLGATAGYLAGTIINPKPRVVYVQPAVVCAPVVVRRVYYQDSGCLYVSPRVDAARYRLAR